MSYEDWIIQNLAAALSVAHGIETTPGMIRAALDDLGPERPTTEELRRKLVVVAAAVRLPKDYI